MTKTKTAQTVTRPYEVAEHLRTAEEVALYLDACIEESVQHLSTKRRRHELVEPHRTGHPRACGGMLFL